MDNGSVPDSGTQKPIAALLESCEQGFQVGTLDACL